MRKLAVLTGVLAVLVGIAGLLFWRSGEPESSRPLAGVKEASATRLLIDRAGISIVLEKKEGGWRLTSPVQDAADPSAVNDVVSGLANLTLGSEVSHELESHAAYDLTESSATRIRLFTADSAAPVLDGYFGKQALSYDSLYFRRAGETPVYMAAGLSAEYVQRGAKDFRERALVTIDRDALRTIKVAGPKFSYELSKSSAGWTTQVGGPKAPDLAASGLMNLRAADFAAGTEKPNELGLGQPYLTAEFAAAVRTARYAIGNLVKAEKGAKPMFRYAKVDGRDTILLVSIAEVDDLVKQLTAK